MSPFCQNKPPFCIRTACACLLMASLVVWAGCGKPKEKEQETSKDPAKNGSLEKTEAHEEGAPQPSGQGAKGGGASSTPESPGGLTPVTRPGIADSAPSDPSAAVPKSDAQQVLEAMAAAYWNATSYEDAGYARLQFEIGDQAADQKIDASVAFERPNRIRAHVAGAMVVCDGTTFWAAREDLAGQVVRIPAPQRLTVPFLYADPVLMQAIGQGPSGLPPQLPLLMQKDALNGFINENTGIEMLPPEQIDGQSCRRIAITRPDGKMVLWIETASDVLRRVELPTEGLRRLLEENAQVKSLSLTLELEGARLNAPIQPAAFQFEAPADAEVVSCFVPRHPGSLLGKPVPDLTFTTLDGQEVPLTSQTCTGKATVLFLWATWCGPCKEAFPKIEEAYQGLKNNPNVQFLAVSVDDPNVPADELRQKVESLGVTMPILRDAKNLVPEVLLTTEIPTIVIVGPKGKVQYYLNGVPKEIGPQLISDVGSLLGGNDLFTKQLEQFQTQMAAHAKQVEAARVQAVNQIEAPKPDLTRSEIAPRSEPANFTLKTLWRSSVVKNPGNVLVLHREDGPPQIYVIDGWKGLAEFSEQGEIANRVAFDIPPNGIVGILHEFSNSSGARFFVGTAGTQRQCYVFDSQWKTVLAYPEDGLTRPGAASISDAKLLGIPGSNAPVLCAAYWERPVVDAVSLDGKPAWTADIEHPVLCLAPTGAREASLVGATRRGNAIVLDSTGKATGSVDLDGFFLQWIVSADLNLDGRMEYAGIAAHAAGELEVVGFSLDGRVLWRHPLPEGMLSQPIAPILTGRLDPEGELCWVVPGADGSLRFIDARGQKLDEFNYGAELAGFATTAINGETVFVVSSPEGVEAMVISQ